MDSSSYCGPGLAKGRCGSEPGEHVHDRLSRASHPREALHRLSWDLTPGTSLSVARRGWGGSSPRGQRRESVSFLWKWSTYCVPQTGDQVQRLGTRRQEVRGVWQMGGQRQMHLSSFSRFLVSSLYFLLKNNEKMGKNHSKEQKQQKPSTKATMDFVSLIFYLKFFFANGKKMRCSQHRGFLSLCISRRPPPSGCQRLPQTPGHPCQTPAEARRGTAQPCGP